MTMPEHDDEFANRDEAFQWVLTLGDTRPSRTGVGLPALLGKGILPREVIDFRAHWDSQYAALTAATSRGHRLVALPSKGRDVIGRIGTLVEITDVLPHGSVVNTARLEGLRRVLVTSVTQHRPYPVVMSRRCRLSNRATDRDRRIHALVGYVRENPEFPEEDVDDLRFLSPSDQVDRLATLLAVRHANKLALLRAGTLEQRLQLLESHVSDLDTAPRRSPTKTEPADPPVLPDEVSRAIEREKADGSGWHDRSQMIIGFLTDLHWTAPPSRPIDLVTARQVLDASHAGLDDVKEAVVDYLAVHEWRRRKNLPNSGDSMSLCLVGPPGTGKTSIAVAIAEASNRKLERIPLGDVDDVFLAGSDRAYSGSRPGEVLRRLRSAERHPSEMVFLLDEIDKISQHATRSPLSVLLALLDPSQNTRWMDQCLGSVPIDLSSALFIATANDEKAIAAPLRDRMRIIRVRPYSRAEQLTIARDYILPKLLTRLGVESQLHITPDALARIVHDSPATGGMRQVEQRLITVIARGIRRHLSTRRIVNVDTPMTMMWLPRRTADASIGFRSVMG